MEKLIVENFLSIEKAELEIGRFTVIIGPQASGKSVLAKLVYFFRDFLRTELLKAAENLELNHGLSDQCQIAFERLFPRYAWNQQVFSITYQAGAISARIYQQNTSDGKLSADFSDEVRKLYLDTKHLHQRKPQQLGNDDDFEARIRVSSDIRLAVLAELSQLGAIGLPRFIPASRSFFANLQSSFTLAGLGFQMDALLQQFGSVYENAKRIYEKNRPPAGRQSSVLFDAARHEAEEVLGGRYRREDNRDWIDKDNRQVMLTNASSGQQESLPMLLVLTNTLLINSSRNFIIEEPEAHLFPTSEKRMVTIFSLLYEAGNDFLMTTHSPYILTAINDSILAAEVLATHPEQADKIREILGNARPIAFEDVRAYTITDGRLESILDEENQLIGTNIIDAVSDDFQAIFNGLLAIKYPADGNAG